MSRKYSIAALLVLFMGFNSCQKKEMKLTISESECKDFSISKPSAVLTSPSTCGTSAVTYSYKLSFKYSEKKDCISHVIIDSKFYDKKINGISGVSAPSSIDKASPTLVIGTNTIDVYYTFTFSSVADANNFFLATLKIHTENDYSNKSNEISLALYNTCQVPDPVSYSVVKTVNVTSAIVSITLYDDAAEDGDIVTLNLNGNWVLTNYTIKKAGETFNFGINSGSNSLVIYAVSQGSSGPTTLGVSINGGAQIALKPDLLKGQAINIVF